MTRKKDLKRGSEGSEGSAELLVVYDLRDPAARQAAHHHRNYWGKTHTCVHYLEENVVVLAFRPAPDCRWQAWEGVRRRWILKQLALKLESEGA